MEAARRLGNYIKKLAKDKAITTEQLGILLDCQEKQVEALFRGRAFISYEQLSLLADKFCTTVTDLLAGDDDHYSSTVVHCMNGFSNPQNREKVLDIIDEYMDIRDAV